MTNEKRKLKIRLNPNANVEELQQAVSDNQGYCPCAVFKTDDTECMCKEFREQIADPEFEGFCHCRLYYKTKD